VLLLSECLVGSDPYDDLGGDAPPYALCYLSEALGCPGWSGGLVFYAVDQCSYAS